MASAYLPTYANTHLGHSRNVILFVGLLAGLGYVVCAALAAILSDRVGRRRMMLIGWAACLPWSFVVMSLIDTGNPICYAVAIVGMKSIVAIGFGPIAAFIPELLPTRYRYSGSALAVNLAGVAGGAVPQLIAEGLRATFGGLALGVMLAVLALGSLVCTYLLPETNGTVLRSIRGADDESVIRGADDASVAL